MVHPHIASLRTRLLALVLLSLAPSMGLALFNLSERRHDAVNQVDLDAERLIERTSAEIQRLLDGSRDLLVVIAQTPDVRNTNCPAADSLFRRILPKNRQYTNFGLADTRGRLLCSALPARPGIDIGDRGYFRRAVFTRGFAVGEYQVGRINDRPAVNVAYPVLDARGEVKSVLFAAYDLGFLNQLASNLNLPPRAEFTIADRRGTVVIRYPDPGPWVGKPYVDLPEGRTVLTHGTGVTELKDANGETFQYVFAPLTEAKTGLEGHVCVGMPHTIAFAKIDFIRMRNLLFLLCVVILTTLAASVGADVLVLRRVKGLLKATQRITAGDLTVRTGLGAGTDELALLGKSFDEMAHSLQVARADLLRAEHERQDVYTEVIRCVTQDKFHLVERDAIPLTGSMVREMPLANAEDYSKLRRTIREVASEAGMATANIAGLVQATGEAATNALKHGRDARWAVFRNERAVFTRVCDSGPGIRAQELAATILQPGFSTKISLGMGYTLMLELADRVWLATGPEGTVVQLEMALATHPDVDPGLEAAMARMS